MDKPWEDKQLISLQQNASRMGLQALMSLTVPLYAKGCSFPPLEYSQITSSPQETHPSLERNMIILGAWSHVVHMKSAIY